VIVFFLDVDRENDTRVILVQPLSSTSVCVYTCHVNIYAHGDSAIDTESISDPNTHTHTHTHTHSHNTGPHPPRADWESVAYRYIGGKKN
jgi:hypothetical protein